LETTITYTVRITNTGPNAMTRLVITDTYDATCMTLTGATGFAPTQTSPGRLLWDTLIPPQPPLLSGQGITLTLVFRADMVAAACMNTATVSGVDQFGQPATPPSSQAPVQITDAADLRVVKQDQPDPVTAGETLTYTIVATNDGPLPATGVVVTDTLPTEVTLVNAAPAQGSGPNPLVWGVGALAAGDSITFTVVVTVDADASGLITNTVAVSGEQRDPTPDNNVADEPTTVNRVADLGIDKSERAQSACRGPGHHLHHRGDQRRPQRSERHHRHRQPAGRTSTVCHLHVRARARTTAATARGRASASPRAGASP
jgi:uncharacterized repeat protein (TIGR01451 family)